MSDTDQPAPVPERAFDHVPELRGRILPPGRSKFRFLSGNKPGWEDPAVNAQLPAGWRYSDEDREALRNKTLRRRLDQDLWVFGYGSLMWDPAIMFQEIRRAHLNGYFRHFCLKSVIGRGSVEKPGLMAALDHGGSCHGLIFRIAAHDVDKETEILWKREVVTDGYIPRFVPIHTPQGTVEALAFTINRRCPRYVPHLDLDETAGMIATGEGVIGRNADYVLTLAQQLRVLQISDHPFESLHEKVTALLDDSSPAMDSLSGADWSK